MKYGMVLLQDIHSYLLGIAEGRQGTPGAPRDGQGREPQRGHGEGAGTEGPRGSGATRNNPRHPWARRGRLCPERPRLPHGPGTCARSSLGFPTAPGPVPGAAAAFPRPRYLCPERPPHSPGTWARSAAALPSLGNRGGGAAPRERSQQPGPRRYGANCRGWWLFHFGLFGLFLYSNLCFGHGCGPFRTQREN